MFKNRKSLVSITSMGEKSSKMNGKMFIFIYLSNNESSVAAISSHTAWSMPSLTVLSSSKNNASNKYFCTNATSYHSKYASGSLDKLCKIGPLNSFILQYLCHN